MIASLDLYVAATTIFIVLDFMSHNFPKKKWHIFVVALLEN